ncbi:hypothetical protein M2325_000857 [Methanococcus voltae PS]|uniref:Uncharacterized protein n=1 Tax=Methanococcus voltae PS TaxID=523842 RepID=A0ABT2EW42_METVO|nr:hypothetical protein [Methanococcus voltae]MCS3922172.1 hypothetical protein [Methanococcus voltae PS]
MDNKSLNVYRVDDGIMGCKHIFSKIEIDGFSFLMIEDEESSEVISIQPLFNPQIEKQNEILEHIKNNLIEQNEILDIQNENLSNITSSLSISTNQLQEINNKYQRD